MMADRRDRKRGRARMRLIEELRAEFELVTTTLHRVSDADTPLLAGLVRAAWAQPGARWVHYMGVSFPVRGGDDWARTVLDPVTREPLIATSGGWLV